MDATDRQLAEIMLRQMEANLDDLRANDGTYADIVYVLGRIAYYRQRLHDMTFGCTISGCAR